MVDTYEPGPNGEACDNWNVPLNHLEDGKD